MARRRSSEESRIGRTAWQVVTAAVMKACSPPGYEATPKRTREEEKQIGVGEATEKYLEHVEKVLTAAGIDNVADIISKARTFMNTDIFKDIEKYAGAGLSVLVARLICTKMLIKKMASLYRSARKAIAEQDYDTARNLVGQLVDLINTVLSTAGYSPENFWNVKFFNNMTRRQIFEMYFNIPAAQTVPVGPLGGGQVAGGMVGELGAGAGGGGGGGGEVLQA